MNCGVAGVCSDNIVFSPIFAPTGDIFNKISQNRVRNVGRKKKCTAFSCAFLFLGLPISLEKNQKNRSDVNGLILKSKISDLHQPHFYGNSYFWSEKMHKNSCAKSFFPNFFFSKNFKKSCQM